MSTVDPIDAAMRACGVAVPQDTLSAMVPKAQEVLEPYGCNTDDNAVKIMAYLMLLPVRETTMPCINKLNQLLLIFCPEVGDDLVF